MTINSVGIPLLNKATQLLVKIRESELSDSQLAKFICEDTLNTFAIRGFYLGRVQANGTVNVLLHDRESDIPIDGIHNFPLDVDMPLTRTIRTGQVVWVDYRKDPALDYPALAGLEVDPGSQTLIMAPIMKAGVPLGMWGFSSPEVINPEGYWSQFFLLIAEMIATRFQMTNTKITSDALMSWHFNINSALNEREKQILSMMANDLTNADIAEQFGLSESTIRLNTIQIFRKLGVNSRDEAKNFYLKSAE